MTIDKKETGGEVTIYVSGHIDVSTSSDLRKALNELDLDSLSSLTLDFSRVDYISSAGLRELLVVKKKLGDKKLSVIGVNKLVAETFEVTGFASFIDFELADENKDYRKMSFSDFLDYKVRYGTKDAIIDDNGREYTWDDVEKCSELIAYDLHALGVGKGTHVGICGKNSANWIFTFYAVQKLGAIACLVNSSLFPAEIATVSGSGDITFLCIGDMPTVSDMAEFKAEVLGADGTKIQTVYDISGEVDFCGRYAEYETIRGRCTCSVEPDDACTMIFTSGSTGVPKGALLSAYNILNAAELTAQSTRLTSEDRACVILPLFHIFGLVTVLFASAVSDAKIILPPSTSSKVLLDTIETKRCTVMHSVPTVMLSIVNNENFSPERVSSLRSTIFGGAAMPAPQMLMLQEKFPNNHFSSAYGMSEMSPISITDYDDTVEHITQTVGKPLKNVMLTIRDPETNTDCPVGRIGEIFVQGFNLMCFYYKVPADDQTIDKDGWLHTGDLGFFDEQGYIHFAGRSKEVIIRGGENIYPGEVAEAVSALPGIADVKVLGVPDPFWGEIVVAAVTLKDGCAFDADDAKKASGVPWPSTKCRSIS